MTRPTSEGTRVVNGACALWRAEAGQDLMEYGILMALIAIFAMGAVSFLGQQTNDVLWQAIANNF